MKTLLSVVTAAVFSLVSVNASSDYREDDGAVLAGDAQDIVVTFSHDLVKLKWKHRLLANRASVERACLALTLAQMLRDPIMNGGNDAVNVSIFLRNDGVKLADPELVSAISQQQSRNHLPGCVAPWYPHPITLEQHLEDFIHGSPGGNYSFVNCPICWCAYKNFSDNAACAEDYVNEGYPGVLNPMAIPPMFLGAEKVIDF